jgi:hypothetical protein
VSMTPLKFEYNRFSWRIRSHMRNSFKAWIRALDEKNRGSKISCYCPLKEWKLSLKSFSKEMHDYVQFFLNWISTETASTLSYYLKEGVFRCCKHKARARQAIGRLQTLQYRTGIWGVSEKERSSLQLFTQTNSTIQTTKKDELQTQCCRPILFHCGSGTAIIQYLDGYNF